MDTTYQAFRYGHWQVLVYNSNKGVEDFREWKTILCVCAEDSYIFSSLAKIDSGATYTYVHSIAQDYSYVSWLCVVKL